MTSSLLKAVPQMRVATRQMSVISGPPQTRISMGEKLVHGITIGVSMLAVPAYILCNIRNYKARD